jgi:hypothetical protein
MKRLLCSSKEEERMLRRNFYLTLTVALALIVALLTGSPAFAITFTVNSTLDQPDDLTIPGTCHTAANTCTLRAAIMQANRTTGTAIIMLPSGIYKLTIPAAGADGEENGDLNLTTPVIGTPVITIIGAGADTTIIDAGKIDRVFNVHERRWVAIEGVTIRNGYAEGGGGIHNSGVLTVSNAIISGSYSTVEGGGIRNWGTLTVLQSTISGNYGDYSGGGIRNYGTLTVTDSTISQNATVTDGSLSQGYGGGIINTGTMLVTGSTISSNTSNSGGGIYQADKAVTVVNSTVSQNSAMNDGGGFYNFYGTVNVYNSTIVFNDADSDRENGGTGGGVFNLGFIIAPLAPSVFNLRNTLVAGNTLLAWPIYQDDCYGTIGSYGRNLFGTVSNACTITGTGIWLSTNPAYLGPLQNNGGPTWTHALLPGNNAIDDGVECIDHNGHTITTDQRGWARPQGDRCDVGSYEFGAASNTAVYFPHVSTSPPWQTEIAIINTGDHVVTGTLRALGNGGQLVETKNVALSPHGRVQITVANEFTNHADIGYIIFDTKSAVVKGYTKFYQAGKYRAAIPAVREVNTSDICIPHIASDAQWWTGISLINTTSATKVLTITFNNGQTRQITLNANEHRAFDIASLFNNQPQPDILSAVITNASGIIGLELFGGSNQLDGILLTDKTASALYYPHVAGSEWWTGIVAYNPSESAATITIKPYSVQGTPLTPSTPPPIPGKGKYIGAVAALDLPAETAWFRIDSTLPLSGFELFGTVDGEQLAPYAGGSSTGAKEGVFAKIEKLGWTGIVFVNTEESSGYVQLRAYNDNGDVVVSNTLSVGGHSKVVMAVEAIFLPQDASSATYIAYSSDRNVIGFQLNGSADWTMLDGLPGM